MADAASAVSDAHRHGQGHTETEYMRFRLYKNGNLHVEFRRLDLVAEANRIIAEHFGATVADDRKRNAA